MRASDVVGERAVSFRIVVIKVHAELTPGKTQHGELCPNEWIYHYFTAPGERGADDGDAHRRRTTTATDEDHADDHDDDGARLHLRLTLYK